MIRLYSSIVQAGDYANAVNHSSDLPVLPLRDVVVYPHMVIPLFVGREKSIKALDQRMEGDKQILLVRTEKRRRR